MSKVAFGKLVLIPTLPYNNVLEDIKGCLNTIIFDVKSVFEFV